VIAEKKTLALVQVGGIVALHVEELFHVPPGHETVQDEIASDVVISNRD
jgi:hypothetical protein